MSELTGLIHSIYRAENRGKVDYNVVYGGIKKADRPKKPITQMTVGEVLAWQDSIDSKYNSEAAGAGQFMEDTLRGLVRKGAASVNDIFNEKTQDNLTVALMREKGLDKFMSGKMSAQDFGTNLARVWASLPVLKPTKDAKGRQIKRGQAVYGGVGANKSRAFMSADAMEAVLNDPSNASYDAASYAATGTAGGATDPAGSQPQGDPAVQRYSQQNRYETDPVRHMKPWEVPDVDLVDQTKPRYGSGGDGDNFPEFSKSGTVDYQTRTGAGQGPILHPGKFKAFTDEWTDSFIYRSIEQDNLATKYKWDKSFDPIDQAVKDGMPDQYRFLGGAKNKEHYDALKEVIHQEGLRGRRREVWDGVAMQTLGGMLNPDSLFTMLLPVGGALASGLGSATRGAGRNALRGSLKTSAAVVATETPIEAGRASLDPYSNSLDSAFRVGGAGLLGGLIGGAGGIFSGIKARQGLATALEGDLARAKGVGTVTKEAEIGGGKAGVRVVVGSEQNGPAPAMARGVVVKDGEIIVDEDVIIRRFKDGTHGTDAKTPNELMEYEIGRAAGLHRRLANFAKDESGSVPVPGKGPKAEPFYTRADDGTVSVNMDQIKKAMDEDGYIELGPSNKDSNIKPLRVKARSFESPEAAADAVKKAADHSAQARDSVEFEQMVGVSLGGKKKLDGMLDPAEIEKRANIERQAEMDGAEALETHRLANNKVLQKAHTQALAVLTDGPYKRIQRNAFSGEARDLVDKLASDGAFLRGSDGTGVNIGPSVHSRAKTWHGVVWKLYERESDLYEKYLGFEKNPSLLGIRANKSFARKRADGSERVSVEQFRKRVTQSYITGEKDDIPEVMEMAEHLRGAWDEYHVVAKEYGVLSNRDGLTARAEHLREQMDQFDPEDTAYKDLEAELNRITDAQRAAKQEPSEDYFTRIFSRKAIQDNREAFKRDVVIPWMRQQPYGDVWKEGSDEIGAQLDSLKAQGVDINQPRYEKLRTGYADALRKGNTKGSWERTKFDTTPAAINSRADDMIEQILGEAEPEELSHLRSPHRPTFGRKRQFDIPNSFLLKDGSKGNGTADYIETDYMLVQNIYAERMGPAIEMARSFARPRDGISAEEGFAEAIKNTRQAEKTRFAKVVEKESGPSEKVTVANRKAHIEKLQSQKKGIRSRFDTRRQEYAEAKDLIRLSKLTDEEIPDELARTEREAGRAWDNKDKTGDEGRFDRDNYIRGAIANKRSAIDLSRRGTKKAEELLALRATKQEQAIDRQLSEDLRLAEADDVTVRQELDAAEAREKMGLGDDPEGFADHWAPIERDLLHLRDRVTNRVIKQPDRWDNRAATALRNWSHLAFMGMSALPAMTEIGTLMMRHGVGRIWQHTMADLDVATQAAMKANADEMGAAGAIMEIVSGTALARFAETGMDSLHGTAPERWLKTSANRYFMWNGLAPLSTRLKEIDAHVRVHDMVARIDRVKMMGKGAEKADLEELDRWGISRKDAEAMADQPIFQTDEGHWQANTAAWGDEALVRKFRAAIAQGNENTIMMATAADKPTIVDGTAYLRKGPRVNKFAVRAGLEDVGDYWRVQSGLATLPFTFWNYAFAAHNKILVAGLDEPSAQKLGGIAAMVGIGAMVSAIRTPEWKWDKQSAGEKMLAAVDQSGVTGIMSQVWGIMERDTPMDKAMRAAGAGPNVAANLLVGAATGDVNTLSWSLPLRNYFLLKQLFDSAVQGIENQQAGF